MKKRILIFCSLICCLFLQNAFAMEGSSASSEEESDDTYEDFVQDEDKPISEELLPGTYLTRLKNLLGNNLKIVSKGSLFFLIKEKRSEETNEQDANSSEEMVEDDNDLGGIQLICPCSIQ